MNAVPLHAAPSRPAWAVLATFVAAIYPIHAAYLGTNGLLDHDAATAAGSFLVVIIWGVLLAGLWADNHLAYVLATVAAILTAVGAFPGLSDVSELPDAVSPALRLGLGVALLLVLLVPASNRAFYARRRRVRFE